MTEPVVLEGDAACAAAPVQLPSAAAFAPEFQPQPEPEARAAGSTLEIDAAAQPAATVAALAGELDRWTAPTLVALLDELAAQCVAHLVLDLKRLYFVDASGLLLLLDAHRALQERGGRLSLVGVRPRVVDILRRTGADQVLPVYRTFAQAVRPEEA
ncbi:MAG TPA: STAS domain-containing protein [Actinocrinis sp.]